jgi:hypothetical protein
MTSPTGAKPASELDSKSSDPTLEMMTMAEPSVSQTSDSDDVEAGVAAAVTAAVDTVVETALADAAESSESPVETPVDLAGAVAFDPSGWVAARTCALQASAATAIANAAKAARATVAQQAQDQAAAAAKFSRVASKKAALAARRQANLAAKAAQREAAQTAIDIRGSGRELLAAAFMNPAVQKVSRQARKAAEFQQEQASQLRRRRASIVIVIAAIVGIAVGLYEKRRRAVAAQVNDETAIEADRPLNADYTSTEPAAAGPAQEPGGPLAH